MTRRASMPIACLAVLLMLPAFAAGQGNSAAAEIVREIRIHGNYITPDAEVVRMAALGIGQPADDNIVQEVRARLERTGRFVSVDVRKRFRSLDDPSDVAIIIVVQEYPVPESTPTVLRPIRRTLGGTMFMPILGYTDGYGLTYGARFSFVDGFGKNARVSVPLTWGGTKRAAVEFEKTVASGPFDRVFASAGISRRTNPFYEIDDDRTELRAGASRQIVKPLRASAYIGRSHAGFGALSDRFVSYGVELTLDTRNDPVFPRKAVFASAGYERAEFQTVRPANRLRLDARGYVPLIGQSVLSIRALYAASDSTLPSFEQYLLGGAGTLRGYRAGSFVGDGLAGASAEVRVPLSSVLSFARTGVSFFADTGTTFLRGQTPTNTPWRTGVGGGVFLNASVFQLNADIGVRTTADPVRGRVRVHIMSGFQF